MLDTLQEATRRITPNGEPVRVMYDRLKMHYLYQALEADPEKGWDWGTFMRVTWESHHYHGQAGQDADRHILAYRDQHNELTGKPVFANSKAGRQ